MQEFKCVTPQQVTIGTRSATVKASVYRSSQENRLRAAQLDPALSRYYEVTLDGETASMLLSEIELKAMLGDAVFEELP